MSSLERPQNPSLTVQGAWEGEVSDPGRIFRGNITESSVDGLDSGAPVTVTYQASEKRTTGAAEHGTYALQAGGQEVKLMSFTNLTEATGGRADQETSHWKAVPLPG